MSAAEILQHARYLLERFGWTQFDERDAEDRACLVGALLAACQAANGFPYHGLAEPLRLLRQAIGNSDGGDWNGELGRAYADLEVWNDAPGRTYADVVGLIGAAEQLARAQATCAEVHHASPTELSERGTTFV